MEWISMDSDGKSMKGRGQPGAKMACKKVQHMFGGQKSLTACPSGLFV